MLRTLIFIQALFLASNAQAGDPVEFRFKNVCLAVDMERHEYYSPGSRTRFGSPFLLVPAPFPTPELMDDDDRTGIGVFYLPLSQRSWSYRLESRDRSQPGDCVETPYDFGLVHVTRDPLHMPKNTDPVTCAASDVRIVLMPDDVDVPLELTCPGTMRPGACWASYYVNQDWEARFLVSPDDLSEWRSIVGLVEAFFENELEFCPL